MSISLIMFLFIVLFLLTGIPIGICLAFSSILAIAITGVVPLSMIPQIMFNSIDTFILVAVPFFMLAGNIMSKGGISHILFNFANSLVGWMKGGLAHVNVMASMFFGGISGSSVADAVGLGKIEIDAMTKQGYDRGFSAAVTVASSTLAVVIPPSILMIMYGVVAETSIARQLLAGLIPGLIIALGQMIVNYFIVKKRGYGISEPFKIKNIFSKFKKAILALLTPLIIIFGIFFGTFTPTEASAIAVVYALLISILFLRTIRKGDISELLKDSAKNAGISLFVVIGAMLTSWILTFDRVPNQLAAFLINNIQNKILILLGINVILLIAGCFIDAMSAIIVLTPIFLPVVVQLGLDPIHFGVILVANLALGLITPPVGVCLYAVSSVSKVTIERLTKEVLPYLFVGIITLLLITFFPQIVMALPNAMFH